jgi:hypothetical protein
MKGTAMKNRVILLVLTMFVLIPGCSKTTDVKVKEWTQFQDQIFKVSFYYPKDWVLALEPTKVVVSSSAETAEKFFDYDPRKADGVQIIIASERSVSMQDYAEYIKDFKNTKTADGFVVGQIEDATLGGSPAKKVTYSGIFPENVKMKAVCIATLKDSTIYYVRYAAFSDLFEPYTMVFDSLIASLRLPQKIVIEKGVDPSIPIEQTERYSDDYLQLEYPANFGANDMPRKGGVISAVRFMGNRDGSRRDCTIDIDVRSAKGLSLESVVNQTSKKIDAKSRGNTSISGEKSVFLNEIPQKGVERRTYFVVKNDKFFRVILTYYAPMRKSFLPAFEKVIASIRLK